MYAVSAKPTEFLAGLGIYVTLACTKPENESQAALETSVLYKQPHGGLVKYLTCHLVFE